jgi:hypothetical protein
MRWSRVLFSLVAGAAFLAAIWALTAHVDRARLVTHTVGVFALLAELLRNGVLYPPAPTTDLVYSVFYHPLAFAPYAMLPGAGLDLFPAMRVLVGVETLACLVVLAWLAGTERADTGRGAVRWLAALCALCTLPVCFALVGMRDDPRAALFALCALLVYGGRNGEPARPLLAALCLTLAFFVKATAPLAPGFALLVAALGAPRARRTRTALMLLAGSALCTAAGIAFLQWGLGCDFLGNGLYYLLVEPARAARAWPEALRALARDLCAWQGGVGQPRDLALPALLLASTILGVVRVVRRKADRYDALIFAVWLKTIVTYRSWGTDLNHLLDLALFAALHVVHTTAAWLTPARALCVFLITLGLGQPWRRLVLPAGTPALGDSLLAAAAAGLRAQPLMPTLCEEPFLAWLSGSRPLVTDPFLTFAALRRAPHIKERWFGPPDHPEAVHRLVLMHDPMSNDPWVEHWYRHLHFDAEFLAMVRQHWRTVLVTDTATVLVRK